MAKRKKTRYPVKTVRKRRGPIKLGRSNRSKLTIAFFSLLIIIIALIGRLMYINASDGERFTKKVLSQLDYDSQTIPFKRGDITDRNGTVLATSEKVYNLIFDPALILESGTEYADATIAALNTYFGEDTGELQQILTDKAESQYVVLKKGLTYDEVKPYNDYVNTEPETEEDGTTTDPRAFVKGVWFEEEYKRVYPYNSIASDVIGFTVSGNEGSIGLENYYNSELNGTDGRNYGYVTDISDFERTTVEAVNGNNIVSTIDLNIQRIVEKYIGNLQNEYGSLNTGVIVANPNNGEILAMASAPTFDLSDPRGFVNDEYDADELEKLSAEELIGIYNERWKNYCVNNVFEPGSTAKPMTVAAALDLHGAEQDSSYICDGGESFDNGGVYIPCHNVYGHGTTSLMEALMWSCNDVMMQLGYQIGIHDFVKYQKTFGIGQYTNIDLPGEEMGMIYGEDTMHEVELATNTFGQGFSVNMVQMVAAFSSIINGGHYYQPHIVKSIENESGDVVKSFDKNLVRDTISQETSDWMRTALMQVVEDNGYNTTGTAARVDGYNIGGKTGTGEKINNSNQYVVSFIGFAPVEDPQIVVYVVVDELQKGSQEDSTIPTKMAGDIIKEVLPYLQVFPNNDYYDYTSNLQWGSEKKTETEKETNEDGSEKKTETDVDGAASSSDTTDTTGTTDTTETSADGTAVNNTATGSYGEADTSGLDQDFLNSDINIGYYYDESGNVVYYNYSTGQIVSPQ